MNIGIVSPRNPVPIYSGLLERIYQLSNFLGRDHRVTVYYPDEPTRRDEDGRLPAKQRFETTGLESSVIEILDEWIPAYSSARGVYKTHPWVVRSLRRKLVADRPDRLIVEMPFLIPVALAATYRLDVPVILTEHNVEYKIAERLGIPGTGPLKTFETWAADAADAVVTVSESDKHRLAATVSTDISVAPNGVDVDRFRPAAADPEVERDEGPLLIYHGNLGNAQNSEAVSELTRAIFPRIRSVIPDAKLVLVGPNPPSTQQQGVVTTGLVDCLPEYVASADIAVVPLRSGSGTKLKILEYLASGTPVITTEIGAEGLPLVDGETAIIAESTDSFQQAILQLVDDDSIRDRLASNGRSLVEERFAWSETLETYNDLL